MEMQLLTRYILPGPTYHGELDGVERVAGKNLSVETGIDHCRLKNYLVKKRSTKEPLTA